MLREDEQHFIDRVDFSENNIVKRLRFNQKEEIKSKMMNSKDANRFMSPTRNSTNNLFSSGNLISPKNFSN